MDMNKKAYTVNPDNLLRGKDHPLDMRTITIKNPKVGVERGTIIKASADGTYFVAGDKGEDAAELSGDVVGIIAHNVVEDKISDSVAVAIYTSGGFNAHGVAGVNKYSISEADILSAQKYGLYIHS